MDTYIFFKNKWPLTKMHVGSAILARFLALVTTMVTKVDHGN